MLVCCDTETHRFRRGWMTPRMVCMTVSTPLTDHPRLEAAVATVETRVGPGHVIRKALPTTKDRPVHPAFLLDRKAAKALWADLMADPSVHWLFHNAAYDVRVMVQEVPSSTKNVVAAYEERRIWDTLPREKIMANAVNQLTMRIDPFTGTMTQKGLYTMATLVMRYFSVDITEEKTDPEAWRLRYHELDGVPLAEWPTRAVDYALLDAVWPLHIADAQDEAHPETVDGETTRCPLWPDARSPRTDGHPEGLTRFTAEIHQSRAMIAFESAASWGWRTSRERSEATIREWKHVADQGAQVGIDNGFVVVQRKKAKDGTVSMEPSKKLAPLRERVAAAYGDVPVQLDLGLDECPIPETERKSDNKQWQRWRARRVSEIVKARKLPDIYSDAGAVQYASEVLEHSGDPILKAYAESSSYATYLTKYASMLMEATQVPLTYRIDTMKSTMRSSKTDPPYDQPPRKGGFREAHEPRPGCVFVMADFDQAELRAMAQIHKWWGLGDTLLEMFRNDIDPHVVIAVDILNAEAKPGPEGGEWTYDNLRAARKGKYGEPWAAIAEEYRQLAKVANFGFRGGLGPTTFVVYARGRGVLGLDVERATFVRDVWRARFPEDVAYLREIGEWLSNGPEPEDEDSQRQITVALPFTGLVRGGVTYTSGANGNFQHLIAAVLAWTCFEVWKEQITDFGTGLYGSRVVLPLHDEIILEAPEATAHEAAVRLEEVMRAGMTYHLPDVPAAVQATVSRVWSKNAKRLVDANGRLIPWEPPKESVKNAA